MLKKIKYLIEVIKLLSYSKKVWRLPEMSQILLFDRSAPVALKSFLNKWNPALLDVRGESINVPIILWALFSKGRMHEAYIDCYVRAVKPSLVVTFIDNNTLFYKFGFRNKHITTLSLQNGSRGIDEFYLSLKSSINKSEKTLYSTYALTFGSDLASEYAKYIEGTFIPIGSYLNNNIAKSLESEQNLIVYISQWHPHGFKKLGRYYSHKEFFEDADFFVLKFLKSYVNNNHKSLKIILRNFDGANGVNERNYFKRLFGEHVIFADTKDVNSSYFVIDSAKVVVGIDSTLLYESLARGNRTAFFSFRSKKLEAPGSTFGWPGVYGDEGLFWSNNDNVNAFQRILNYLFEVSDEEWSLELKKFNVNRLMAIDKGNSKLISLIDKVLVNKSG